ncbi:MAG: hypothetical protein GX970_16475, partial [Phyllobacteriaceae bacterium]|nr:hypothetical protein [Phyllobacteriaceae bacterium]
MQFSSVRHRRAMYTTVSPVVLIMAGLFAGQANAVDHVVAAGETLPAGLVLADGDTLTNNGTITNPGGSGVEGLGDVGFILNSATGKVEAVGDWAIAINGNLGSFENHGSVTSDSIGALAVFGDLSSFLNTGTMATTGDVGVGVVGTVGTFNNSGTISSNFGPALIFQGAVGTLTNSGTLQSATNLTTVRFESSVGKFSNAGEILNNGTGVGVEANLNNGGVGSFENSGKIVAGAGQRGVSFYNNGNKVGTFTNSGSIIGGNWEAVFIGGGVDKFVNTSTGVIQNTDASGTDGHGVSFNTGTTNGGAVVAFENHGKILGDPNGDGNGVGFFEGVDPAAHQVGSFLNTGTISGAGNGVGAIGGFGSFTNSGTITSTTRTAVWSDGPNGTFTNSGTVSSAQGNGTSFLLDVDSYENSGTISGFRNGVTIDGAATSFNNSGTITGQERNGVWVGGDVDSFTNSGSITTSEGAAVAIDGTTSAFTNSGTLTSTYDAGVYLGDATGPIINTGTIQGRVGVFLGGGGAQTFTNSGTIRAEDWDAIYFGGGDDVLRLQTGSKIFGAIAFEAGDDTVDVSGFVGNTLLQVYDLENLVKGDRLAYHDAANNELAVVEANGVVEGGQRGTINIATGINNILTPVLDGVLSGTSNGVIEPLGYMPTAPQTAADLAIIDPPAHSATAWATAIGGGSHDGAPVDVNSLYGALVAGTHTQLAPDTTLGVLGGVGSGRVNTNSGGQIVDSVTGIAGFYGRHDAGSIAFDFSLLGGISGNNSARELVALGAVETARASYSSWFISPSIGVAIPVLQLEDGEVDLVGKVSYVGGNVSGYTETGS